MSSRSLGLRESITARKEKMLRGTVKEEPAEFLDTFNELLDVREQLRQVEKALKTWNKTSKALSLSAAQLAKAVGTEEETLKRTMLDINVQLEDKATVRAVHAKVKMLDGLVADRERLTKFGLLLKAQRRKVRALESKDAVLEVKKKAKDAEMVAKARYDKLYNELFDSMDFVVRQAKEKGYTSVIAAELSSFKLQQFHFFMNCQKVIQGTDKEETQSLNKIWIAFTNQLQQHRQRSRSIFSSRKSQNRPKSERSSLSSRNGFRQGSRFSVKSKTSRESLKIKEEDHPAEKQTRHTSLTVEYPADSTIVEIEEIDILEDSDYTDDDDDDFPNEEKYDSREELDFEKEESDQGPQDVELEQDIGEQEDDRLAEDEEAETTSVISKASKKSLRRSRPHGEELKARLAAVTK